MSFDTQFFDVILKVDIALTPLTFQIKPPMWYTSKEAMRQIAYRYVAYYYRCVIGRVKNQVWSNAFKSSGQTIDNSFYISRLYLKLKIWDPLFKISN